MKQSLITGARWSSLCRSLACVLGLCASVQAWALTSQQAHDMAAGEADARIPVIEAAVVASDARLSIYFQALLDDAVKFDAQHAYIVRDDHAEEAATGETVVVPDSAEDVVNDNRLRGVLESAQAALNLSAKDRQTRLAAINKLKGQADETLLPLIDRALAAEQDSVLKDGLNLLRAGVMLDSSTPQRRLEAAHVLEAGRTPAIHALLQEHLDAEKDPAVHAAIAQALSTVEGRLAWGERAGVIFSGVSLGSILLLAALGLAINYGLMGVINMAHGEMMMIGAYATYAVQNVFHAHWPGHFDAYLIAAVPMSFLVAAAVGAILERSVIRWLYGRPLETLLATWGISLVLMQTVRTIFGAQNVQVENPSWLSGGAEVLGGLTLPYNRIAIIAFAALVLAGMALLIAKTRLGLYVRSVTQNRAMAACVGVNTKRVDTLAFSLGAGLAGLAGCALSQIGNVGPDLGQSYIVDSFMVVVLGGVGQLAGTVYAAIGLGLINKLLEGWAGAVLAKIMVLAFIVIFIQKRPQGLFAMKGRSAEA